MNRLLEPFSHITVVVTGTQWSNFLALRDDPDAEPHIQILGHLPFITPSDIHELLINEDNERDTEFDRLYPDWAGTDILQTSKSFTYASAGYKTVEGFDMSFEKANQIYNNLLNSSPAHLLPFEHQAHADGFCVGTKGLIANGSTPSGVTATKPETRLSWI